MELELKDYLKIIRKRIWLIVSFVLLSSIASGVVSLFFLTPIYEASTKLIVNKTEETVGLNQLDLNSVNLNLRLIDTYKEIIKTPAIMNAVATENPQFGMSAEELIKKVRVSSVNNTQVMTLIVEDPSYQRAADIVNAISLVFQREIPNIMSVDNVSILNEAAVNGLQSPIRPNVSLNVAIAFVVSLMLVLGIVLLLEYLDDTIKSERDIEQLLELPTLTIVARMQDDDFPTQNVNLTKRKVSDPHAVIEQ